MVRVLPEAQSKGDVSVEEAISKRRSVRSFSGEALSEEALAQILWAAQGVTSRGEGFRVVPSAGATYPLECYVATHEGVFHYLPKRGGVQEHVQGDRRALLAQAALGQSFVADASAVIVLAAVAERTTRRYGNRGNMYIFMEAGHAAQNVHLQAVALGLGSVPVGAFDDEAVARAIGLPGGQTPLYLIPVGK